MATINVTRGLIGQEDISYGNGTFSRATSTGGTQNITKLSSGAEVFNVKDYGALGDGTTDDSTAIQAALTAAVAASGGTVYVPSGTYLLSTTLTIDDENIHFVGAGRSSVLKASTALSPLMYVGAASGALTANAGNVVSDLMVDLNDTNTTGISWRRWGQKGVNHNIHFINPGATATGIETSGNALINEILFDGINWWNSSTSEGGTNEGTGLKINCNNCRVTNSTFIGATVGIEVASAGSISAFVVDGATRMSRNDYGIRFGSAGGYGGFGLNIHDCRFEDNQTFDIHLHGFNSTTSAWQGVYVRGCYFTGSTGISLQNTQGVKLESLTFKDFTAPTNVVTDDGSNSDFSATNLHSVSGTTVTPLLPTTLSRKEHRFPDEMHVGPGTDAPSQGNAVVYATRAGEVAVVARDATNDVEAHFVANSLGVTIGAKSNDTLFLTTGGTNRVEVGTGGALGINDGISAPATKVGVAYLYVDTADGDLKIKYGDGTIKTIVVDT